MVMKMAKAMAGVMGALMLVVMSSGGHAQDRKIILRVADHLPANHFMVEPMAKYWMAAVTKGSGGAVEFEYYSAEQLGKAKDMLSLALSGVTGG